MENSNSHKAPCAAVLFDIGGVLLQLDYREAFRELGFGTDAETHAAMTLLGNDADYDAFERGTIGEEQYRRALCGKLGREISPEHFRRVWNGIVADPYDGVVALLEKLRRRVPVYALSNSNETHIASVFERFPWFRDFAGVFSSHELGCRKPEPAIYAEAIRRIGRPAEAVVFFDDRADNVAAATAAGLVAYRVRRSPDDLVDALARHLPGL